MEEKVTGDHDISPELPGVVAMNSEQGISVAVETPRPWGFWATVGFSAIMVVAYLVVCVIVAVVFIVAAKMTDPQADFDQIGASLSESGLLMAVSGIVTTPAVVGLCMLFAFCRKGLRVRDYLAVRRVSGQKLLLWLGVLLGFIVVSDTLTLIIGRPIVHESMVRAYETSGFPLLLFFAIIVCAPLAEEIFFRGFLFEGLRATWMGAIGATVVTSLLWAVIHVQYDWYGITSIFVAGLLLGAARIRTKSVLTPMIMHMVMNIIASGELLIAQLLG